MAKDEVYIESGVAGVPGVTIKPVFDEDMAFSTTEGEDKELCEAALDELSDNKGEDD